MATNRSGRSSPFLSYGVGKETSIIKQGSQRKRQFQSDGWALFFNGFLTSQEDHPNRAAKHTNA
jgi:hypothetical protein